MTRDLTCPVRFFPGDIVLRIMSAHAIPKTICHEAGIGIIIEVIPNGVSTNRFDSIDFNRYRVIWANERDGLRCLTDNSWTWPGYMLISCEDMPK